MQVTIADRIRESLPGLPRAEKRVALVVLRNYPVAGLETVARLAETAEVSGPTVMRLCARLGFEGFLDFQQALLVEVADRTASPLAQFDAARLRQDDAIDRTRADLIDALDASFAHLDRTTYAAVVDRIISARRIFTTGGRFTELPARALAMHLEILRDGVQHLTPELRVGYLLSVRRGDVVFVFDVRRYQRSTVEFGREVARKGAQVLLVTDPWLSPLTVDASLVLSVGVQGPSPFDTQVPVMALVEALIASVTEALGDKTRHRLAEYDRIWDEQRFRYPDADSAIQEDQ